MQAAQQEPLPAPVKLELRVQLASSAWQDMLSFVRDKTLSRYPSRDDSRHKQEANLASREAINQFISDLYEEVNTKDTENKDEEYDNE